MNDIMLRISTTLTNLFSEAITKATVLLPEALLAILFLFAGWLVAVLVHHIVLWILGFFAIDKLAAKTPLSTFLKNLGIRKTASEILGLLVFWLIIFFTLVIAADTLHMTQVSYALALIAHFIPQVIAAVLIIIVGMLVAKLLQILTIQALGHVNVAYKKSIGGAVQTVVLIFVFVAALDQIGFELDYVLDAIITLGSVVLLMFGLGLAFGARTVLDNVVACSQVKRQIPPSSNVSIDGTTGTVKEFTLTSVVLDVSGTLTVLPATQFLQQKYTVITP
ncbi:hypothetical protein FJZ28_02345 [Candidatus Peregrinibacteria bacterium]|nr:hypothetical protein [Candidatus Peregrinibacteria bacterium]